MYLMYKLTYIVVSFLIQWTGEQVHKENILSCVVLNVNIDSAKKSDVVGLWQWR